MAYDGTKWAIEHVDELRRCFAEGLSFEDISRVLWTKFHVTYSRNACIGKVSRLGLADTRSKKKPKKPSPVRVAKHVPNIKVIVPKPMGPPRMPIEPARTLRCVGVDPIHVTFDDLADEQCHWPYGDTSPFTFCGHPIFGEAPYCASHVALAQRRY